MKLLTFQDIADMNPRKKHWPSKYIPETWTGTILDVLRLPNVAATEKLWVACRVLDDKVLRLFAVDCARRALSRIDKPDARSLAAVNVAEAFAHGNATTEELKTAAAAAYAAYAASAASAASAAAYAASAEYAASAAAYAASAEYAIPSVVDSDTFEERNKQIEQLIKLIQEYTVIKLIPEYADRTAQRDSTGGTVG